MKNKTLSSLSLSKGFLLLILMLNLAVQAFSQVTPAPTSSSTKKTVQIAGKWYIETTTTTKVYTELTTQLLLQVEEDAQEAKRDDEEVERKQEERLKRKTERIERNQLLKDAISKGYKPEPQTLEEQEKIRKARAKLGIK